MPVFFVCAGLLGLLVVLLTVNVGRMRGRKKINLGDGGDPEMIAAIRAHANLIEFAPLCLLLIYMASDFYGFWTTAVLSLVLLVSRVLHVGGMLGFIIAFWLFSRKYRIYFPSVIDVLVCVVPIGLFFGRLANFINGELYGRVTDAPLGMVFPYGGDLPRHPTQSRRAAGPLHRLRRIRAVGATLDSTC